MNEQSLPLCCYVVRHHKSTNNLSVTPVTSPDNDLDSVNVETRL